MAESKTPIIVALIGVVGAISAAYISKSSGSAVSAPGPQTSMPVAKIERLSESQAKANGDAATVLDPVPAQIAADARRPPQIDGSWYASEGVRSDFTQSGSSYSFVQYVNGGRVGAGQGTLDGRRFKHSFSADDGMSGVCEGEFSTDVQTSVGRCTSNSGESWDVVVRRR